LSVTRMLSMWRVCRCDRRVVCIAIAVLILSVCDVRSRVAMQCYAKIAAVRSRATAPMSIGESVVAVAGAALTPEDDDDDEVDGADEFPVTVIVCLETV